MNDRTLDVIAKRLESINKQTVALYMLLLKMGYGKETRHADNPKPRA